MRISIVGVGLIGGSIALASRNLPVPGHVTGWDPDRNALDVALKRGAIDNAAPSLVDAVADAQVVFVAAPVGVLPETVGAVLAAAPESCVVSDVGSTKRSVVLAHDDPRFVGGHPLAGAEMAGVAHARANLFEAATWYLTPSPGATGVLFERLHRLIRDFGAHPTAIDAETHDSVLASVSHLPHVFANVLATQATGALNGSQRLPATGPSFRDATRVAGASSAIWTDIYLSNRDALVRQIDEAVDRLSDIREMLARADAEAITTWNDDARENRKRLLETQLAGGSLHELRASVANEPGVLARITLELGKAGVNIADMALYPTQDHSEGTIALFIVGNEPAKRALEVITDMRIPVQRA